MAKREIFICDACGKEHEGRNNSAGLDFDAPKFGKVVLDYFHYTGTKQNPEKSVELQDLCVECTEDIMRIFLDIKKNKKGIKYSKI